MNNKQVNLRVDKSDLYYLADKVKDKEFRDLYDRILKKIDEVEA
jgi:hypothetical protein